MGIPPAARKGIGGKQFQVRYFADKFARSKISKSCATLVGEVNGTIVNRLQSIQVQKSGKRSKADIGIINCLHTHKRTRIVKKEGSVRPSVAYVYYNMMQQKAQRSNLPAIANNNHADHVGY